MPESPEQITPEISGEEVVTQTHLPKIGAELNLGKKYKVADLMKADSYLYHWGMMPSVMGLHEKPTKFWEFEQPITCLSVGSHFASAVVLGSLYSWVDSTYGELGGANLVCNDPYISCERPLKVGGV